MRVTVVGLSWGSRGGYRRVEARGGGDRIDPVVRSIFGLGRKTRRKSFLVAGGGGDGGGSSPEIMERERYGYIKNHKKTVKNGQARTRERKSVQKPEAKP
ncbi:hypothetical protein Tco_0788682 [Tanacetum coccineum]